MRVVTVLLFVALLSTYAAADTVDHEDGHLLPGLGEKVELDGFRVAERTNENNLSAVSLARDADTGILLLHAYKQSCDFMDDVFTKTYADAEKQPAVFSWMPARLERMRTSPRAVMACMELRTAAVAVVLVITPDLVLSDTNDAGFAAPLQKISAAYTSKEADDTAANNAFLEARAERAHGWAEYENRGDTTTQVMVGAGFGYNLNLEDDVNYGAHFVIEGRMVPNRGSGLWAQANFVFGTGEGDFAFYSELAGQLGYGFATKNFLAAPLLGVAATKLGPSGPLELMVGGVAEIRNGRNELTLRVQGLKCVGSMGIEHDEISVMGSRGMFYAGVRRLWWDDEPADAVMLPGDNFLPDRGAWYLTIGIGGSLD
jgi:hypothetical protein